MQVYRVLSRPHHHGPDSCFDRYDPVFCWVRAWVQGLPSSHRPLAAFSTSIVPFRTDRPPFALTCGGRPLLFGGYSHGLSLYMFTAGPWAYTASDGGLVRVALLSC